MNSKEIKFGEIPEQFDSAAEVKPTRVNEETKKYCLEMAVKIHSVGGFQMNDSVLDTYQKVLDLFINKPSK